MLYNDEKKPNKEKSNWYKKRKIIEVLSLSKQENLDMWYLEVLLFWFNYGSIYTYYMT